MADGDGTITVEIVDAAAGIPAPSWDACAGADNPFLSHAFFHAVESSGSATAETGWFAQHLVARDPTGQIVGVVPAYLKSHSFGEYVFDHSWADAWHRAGGRYYPKLQIAIPFTPVTGRRLLVAEGPQRVTTQAALIAALAEVARRRSVSSAHVTFCTPDEAEAFAAAGWLVRQGCQYHWENHGYRSFDDFLTALSHGRRKAIRRERRDVAAQGIDIETLSGADIEPAHWDAFFDFYISTSDRKWGSPYLTRAFFHLLGDSLGD
ncbi:MAG: N-acetyltransferase, partial [Rhodospirillales bacterium]|nr:N-acetyltransferase [Rhodospirillales bacterium]